ncbi:MAG: hypothetical protein MUC59_05640 [Saprospiraceae bacterium]|jgi:hypothetical protein|nr:hypothetical protein [Saprospiraceae bacterium]
MNTSALIMWLSTVLIVGGFCGYFFYRVLTAKKKSEPDSYSDNDDKA